MAGHVMPLREEKIPEKCYAQKWRENHPEEDQEPYG